MEKTVYVPTLIQFQKYYEPYYITIEYTGSEDITKAAHGFIEGLVKADILTIENYSPYDYKDEYYNIKKYIKALKISKDDDKSTLIQKLCNFVKDEDDLEIVITLFGLNYEDSEISSVFTVNEIKIV